jgi:hypothetical protein
VHGFVNPQTFRVRPRQHRRPETEHALWLCSGDELDELRLRRWLHQPGELVELESDPRDHHGKDTETVVNALIKNARKLPQELYKSLTWDRCKEMAAHKRGQVGHRRQGLPVCTPALIVLLGVVAGRGSPAWGALLLLAFALGRAVPIALGAGAIGWLEQLRPLSRWQRGFDIAGGVTLILTGLYMLNAYFFFVPALAG